jgi:hypothetical protein
MPDRPLSARGQRDLHALLKTMTPVLQEGEYVFCTLSEAEFACLSERPLGMFREAEGITVILRWDQAMEANLAVGPRWRLITLSVHSDLEAVGFLAAIATALAAVNISVNAVSAYFHDHLFVPSPGAEVALQRLMELSHQAQASGEPSNADIDSGPHT